MDEKDREFLQSILQQFHEQSERRFDGLERRFDGLESRFEESERRFDGMEMRIEESERRLGVLIENVDHKLDLLAEGQQMLAERLDRTALELKEEIGKVDKRVTILASDLSAHKSDMEVHRGMYVVKESE